MRPTTARLTLLSFVTASALACGTASSSTAPILPPADPNETVVADPSIGTLADSNQQIFVATGQAVVIKLTEYSDSGDELAVGPTLLGTPKISTIFAGGSFTGIVGGYSYKTFTWTTDGIPSGRYTLTFTQSQGLNDPSPQVFFITVILGTE